MLESQEIPPNDSQARADSTVRPLARRYVLVLASVAALVALDQAILQPHLVQLNFSAPVINLAGRQRMLSQKLSKEALALQVADDAELRDERREDLRRSLAQWTSAHRALLEGDADRGVQPVDSQVADAMRGIEPAFSAMQSAVAEILADRDPARSASAAARILELEPVYLRGMEQVVAMLERAAGRQVAWLRACGVAAMLAIIALLSGVYFVVLRPATLLIRTQVEQLVASDTRHRQLAAMLSDTRDTLEQRVAARTSELHAANLALEREMAERQAAQVRMQALSTELAHASRVTALGQLATGLAHEINQPLATVANCAGTLELILDRATPGEQQQKRLLVERIQQAALRAGAIVRRMRNFVRRGEFQALPVDLNVLVEEVCELCRMELRDSDVQLTLDLAPAPAMAAADGVQIQQVLVNLIHNAIQAMSGSAAAERKLLIRTQLAAGEVSVSVCDTGPGLSSEIIDHCFAAFHSSKREGLGLGLAISRSIIEHHQGRIWTENRECGGAVVGFNLPRLNTDDIGSQQRAHCICG
jgi:C4-dicarboxylate-specific signal transduction histidine kinase